MFVFLLKRLFLLIPSLLLISLVAFGLNQCSPSDRVIAALPTAKQSDDVVAQLAQQKRQYRDALKKHGLHLPLFYFNLTTQAHPDTLHRIIPLARRERIKQLLGQTGNWPALQAYIGAYDHCYKSLLVASKERPNDTLIELRQLFLELDKVGRLEQISPQLQKIDLLVQGIVNSNLLQNFAQLQQAAQVLQTHVSRWRLYVPALHLHGSDNRYHQWLGNSIRGDFGISQETGQPAVERIQKAVGWTLQINLIAIFLAFLIAIPLGVYSAVYREQKWVRWSNIILFLLYALPGFWVATMLVKFLTTPEWLFWFPSHGVGDIPAGASWWETFQIRAQHLALPIFCLSYSSLALITRQVRRSMLDVWSSDFVRTAAAKGLPKRRIIWRHAFRNSLFPLITMIGNILPAAIAGSVIIEIIFSIPGVGWLTMRSILQYDWPVVYTLLLLVATLTILGLLLADLLYAWADPRTRTNHE